MEKKIIVGGNMRLSKLITKLQELKKKMKGLDPDLIIDHDEHGYYSLENVTLILTEDDDILVNLVSLNES